MKTKLSRLALLGLLVLGGAAVGCQRESVIDDNPNYNPETKEVTTDFVLNITAAPKTKMSATVVQQDQNFRGIQDAKIYAYKTSMTGTPYVLSTAATPEKDYDLGMFLANGALDNTTTVDNSTDPATTHNQNEESSSRRVLQLSIPVNVDAVMFYGKAVKANGATDAAYGATNTAATTISGTPGSTVIAARKILNETNVSQYDATARLMIAVINDILSRSVDAGGSITVGTGENAIVYDNLPALSWAQLGHQYELDVLGANSRYANNDANITNHIILGRPVEGLEEVLGKCYYLFTYIRPAEANVRPLGEYRAGSSAAVRSMIIDMYKVITAASTAEPTNAKEANAQRLAKVILDRALLYFDSDDGEYKTVSEIRELVVTQYKLLTDAEWTSQFGGAQDLNGYPFEDFGVPEGAAQLGFHVYGTTRPEGEGGGTYPKDEFYYYHPNKPLVNPNMTEFEPRKYLYPAELWYYVNSPIRICETDVTIDSYPNGVTPWNATTSWTNWTFPGKVTSSTRGVAVANSINYGVALLKSTVVYKPGVTYLQDNRKKLTNNVEENKQISVSSAQLGLRGILVGGVNPRMNWQFIRKYTSSGNHEDLGDLSLFDGVIYDHSLPSTAVPTAAPNYTMVYDNYNSSEAENNQNDVYVALEFVNGGEAFWGRDNLIPNGGVFYLVAKLEKPNGDQITNLKAQFPSDHQIPPVWGVDGETVTSPAVAGESKKIPRIFTQDFMTCATFQLDATSLQKAYYSVPDLRASQMSLGLSVDLQWIHGIDYTITL